ncbi:MAG: hypothetical protein WC969_06150 [Elusimicrobiota bacterium]|jgi:hypothetical protein
MQALLAFVLAVGVNAQAQQTPQKPSFSPLEVQAAKLDPLAYTIDPNSIVLKDEGPSIHPHGGMPDGPGDLPPVGGGVPPIGGDIDIGQIINIGQQIWQIIENNKPVVDVQTTYAAAVPDGITHWAQLGGWRPPEGRVYQLTAKNMYGANTIDVRFEVTRCYGGNYKGKGKYLTNVTIEPLQVNVLWAYKFSMKAEVPPTSIINVAQPEDPIAGMTVKLSWKIETAVKYTEGTSRYFVQGDGLFKELQQSKISFREDLKKPMAALQSDIRWD